MIAGKIGRHTVGPLNEGDPIHREEFIESQVRELIGMTQSVRIAMPDWDRCRILKDQGERRAVNRFR